MTIPKILSKRAPIAAALALALGGVSNSALADGDDIAALEAKVASLERMVEQLMMERDRTAQAIQEVEVNATTQVDEKIAAAMESLDQKKKADSSHSYKFSGYIKSDVMYSNYSAGDLAPASVGRDFYIPGTIPVGGQDESTDLDFHAKESRIVFRSDHVLDNGTTLGSYVEMDFLLSPGGNERVSNSYNPRLRHAFLKYNNWLFGQTWSTFQNVGALPENLDFVGPAEGTTFQRQPMIRYTNGPWQFALENRESTITPFGGGGRIVTDDGAMPDVVARYTHKSDGADIVLTGLLRDLSYEDVASGIDASETAFGLSLSGKHKIGDNGDDFRWMISSGSGMGRYMGLNTANGAVLDANGDLEAIDSTGGFVSYRHFWNKQWRSNFTASYLAIDNDTALTGLGVTKQSQSYNINLIYSPVAKVEFGIEYMHANREIESGADGDLDRLQFSAKYGF